MENEGRLLKSLKELVQCETTTSLLMGATFYRVEKELKEKNYENFKNSILNKLKSCNLNERKFENEINELTSVYEDAMNKISAMYEYQFERLLQILQENELKQNEMINKLLELKIKYFQTEDEKGRKEYNKLIEQQLEEKGKYDTIVYESEVRLNECLENMQISLNNLGEDTTDLQTIPKDSIFQKIRMFFKKIFIKRNFEKDVKVERKEYLEKVTKESKDIIKYVAYKIKEFDYQITHMKKITV